MKNKSQFLDQVYAAHLVSDDTPLDREQWEAENAPRLISEQIQHAMALAFFACAYADQADECGQSLTGQIMDQLPADIDKGALHAARTLQFDLMLKFIRRYPDKLDAGSDDLAPIYAFAQSLDSEGADHGLTPELFGHYLAMQAMGTGVGLESFGDAVRDAIEVPYCEFGSHSLELDYFKGGNDE
jgi:hypothetical protein